jgi:hypothetical protein
MNAAIRMTFDGEDPVAIHSVVAAGHRIIRIFVKRGDVESYLRFTDWIAPGHEQEFLAPHGCYSNEDAGDSIKWMKRYQTGAAPSKRLCGAGDRGSIHNLAIDLG